MASSTCGHCYGYPHPQDQDEGLSSSSTYRSLPHPPTPVTQPHRRIPFHLRKKLDFELDKLERQGIIEPVDGLTPWVSPLVVTPKPKNPDEIRLCIDMRQPNRAILRERLLTPDY
ncbi:Transposon Ty3-I Gag-Pol poly [Paramuricea clavata]|uniref:Transposon Ty3-I Gag-Pol poly n=1 Tax=Paramuricea clavata TaxID=317549 RepID=A0A7D9DII4_PARCT|nr:Transposon Ty3-I Gag-Pol poly [Paramuricea clavata]